MSAIRCALFILLSVSASAPALVAQAFPYDVDTRPARGLLPDAMTGAIDAIDPVSGSLHLDIPIVSLPPGPTGGGFDLRLSYNSAVYDLSPVPISWPEPFDDISDWDNILWAQNLSVSEGWQYNFDYSITQEEHAYVQSQDIADFMCTAGTPQGYVRTYRNRVRLGDGSQHSLHLYMDGSQENDDPPESMGDFYHYGFFGDNSCEVVNPPAMPGPPVWFTTDGTFAKADWTDGALYLRDGSKVEWESASVTVLSDPNGNEVTVTNSCYDYPTCSQPYTAIRDEYWQSGSDRQIVIDYQSGYDEITAPVSGGTATWTVNWGTVNLTDKGKTYEDYPGHYKSAGNVSHSVVTGIDLPDSRTYTFAYNDDTDFGWGEVDHVWVPSGAHYAYTYVNDISRDQGYLTANPIIHRSVFHDSATDTWDYAYGGASTVTAPDGGQTIYYINPAYARVSKIERPDGSVVEKVFDTLDPPGMDYVSQFPNVYVKKTLATVADDTGSPAKTAISEFDYDRNGRLLTKTEYDWVNYPTTTGSTKKRVTDYDYYFDSPSASGDSVYGYWREHYSTNWSDNDPRRLDAVQRVTVSESGSTPVAVTEFEYDDAYTTGNVTSEEHWDSEKAGTPPSLGTLSTSNATVVTRTYNNLGQLTEIDGDAVNTQISYGTIPGGSGPGPYPTQVVYAPGTGIARTFTYDWDYEAGLLDTGSDADNNFDTDYTYDTFGRILTVDENGIRQTETSYDDTNRLLRVEADLASYQDGKLQAVSHYDQLGRVIRTRVTDGSTLSTSPTATDGINAVTAYGFTSSVGPRVVTSTPYRSTSDPTLEWSCTQYDQASRLIETSMFTGSTAPTDCSATSGRTADATVTYDADMTETTDPADKVRQDYVDALGRLVQVTEDPSGLGYDTTYTYDPLGNLLTVSQGSQTRTFDYSSLGLLIGAVNPENGTVTYAYNDDGSPYQVTDARNITTTFSYDALGRPTGVSYSDSYTPAVTWSYYTSGTNAIGRLQSVSSSVATETFNSYDALGRVLSHTQEIVNNSNDYTLGYTYRLDDSIATMTYPSGREVDYAVDDAGRVRTVDDGTRTFADISGDVTDIDPLGRIANMALGNGLYETRSYRPAGTATELELGTSGGGSERLSLEYSYSGTGNNGNLLQQIITRPSWARTQTYTYDAVNRLSTASESSGGFNRIFEYDEYGNRWLNPSSTGPSALDSHEPESQSNFSTTTNRLNIASSTYDNAGNQTTFSPYTLTFDAVNRLTEVESTTNGNAYYAYDGNGRRVGKAWTPNGGSQVLTYTIYDIAGRMVAEYTDGDPGAPGLSYIFQDLLGSVRAVTDESGNVDECYDYTPFGRMLTTADNGRSAAGCYPSSPSTYTSDLREKFTGQQRDEVMLDYFIARYYADGQGRFTGADPLTGWPGDPQSWNRYTYAKNNPLLYTDPFGLTYDICHDITSQCVVFSGPFEDVDFQQWLAGAVEAGYPVPEGISSAPFLATWFCRGEAQYDCYTITYSERDAGLSQGADALYGTRDYYLWAYGGTPESYREATGPDYYLDFGVYYFDRMKALAQASSSNDLKTFIDGTGRDLQVLLDRLIAADPSIPQNRGTLFRAAFDTHSSAYLRNGFMALNGIDMAQVIWTIRGDLYNPLTLKEILETLSMIESPCCRIR